MLKTEKNKVGLGLFSFFLVWLGHEFFSSRGTVVLNRGVSFGIEVPVFLVAAFFLVWILALVYFRKSDFFWSLWGLVVGGGVNFLDRLRWGGVRDYFNFFGLFYNNLADWVIFISILSFVVLFFIKEKNEKR